MTDWQLADLHIHSALSPCADDEMTPQNIVNMAKLVGLAVIAVTDHQAADNVAITIELAREQGIICLPGIEVQTREEVHLLAYFPEVAGLLAFTGEIQSHISERWLATPRFGRQLIMGRGDQVLGEHEVWLLQSAMLSVEQVWALTEQFAGCCVPAHLDRGAFSLQSQLGFLPSSLPISTVEYSQAFLASHPETGHSRGLLAITSSDAHSLGEMVTLGNSRLHASLSTSQAICQALKSGDRQLVQSYRANHFL